MNSETPLKAEVMISHAWGESVVETLVAVVGKASVSGMTLGTAIWFCTFAQYQAGDMKGDCGPSVKQQLLLDPFKSVIHSRPRYGMLVVHTSTAELYSRLWCVHEIDESLEAGVLPISAYSMGALQKLKDCEDSGTLLAKALEVDTSRAECWSQDDAKVITSKIMAAGGFEKLNKVILEFRMATIQGFCEMFNAFADWAGSTDNTGRALEALTEVVDKAGIFVGL